MLKAILATVFLFSAITVQRVDTSKQYPIDTNHPVGASAWNHHY